MKYTIADIRQLHKAGGGEFFSRGAMRFFDSSIESSVYQGAGGVYFITSEQFHGLRGSMPRKYSVRRFDPADGGIETVQWQRHDTLQDAKLEARLLAGKGEEG